MMMYRCVICSIRRVCRACFQCRLGYRRRLASSWFSCLYFAFSRLLLYAAFVWVLFVICTKYLLYEGIYKIYFVSILSKNIPKVKDIDCKVFLNPPEKWNDTLQDMSERFITEETFDYSDCSKLKSGGFNIPTSDMEDRFPIAFSILVYNDMPRLTRLLRAVYRSSNVYCIHADKKSSFEIKAKVSLLASCFENVVLAPNPVNVKWGGTTVLEAEMRCLRALWRYKVKWLAFINLTGEEFPLKTNLELVNILHIMGGRNDAWIDPCTLDGPGDVHTPECLGLTQSGFSERWNFTSDPPYNIHPYKGQVHVVLSRAAADFVLHSKFSLALYDWLSNTLIPDELFFSSLNSNPHLDMPGSNPQPRVRKSSIARLKLWETRHQAQWSYCSMYLRSVCLLTARELPLLTTSRQLFANKFKSNYSPAGYSCLEQWYFERVLAELKNGYIQLGLQEYHRIFHGHNV